MDFKKKLKELEKRIELLENKGPQGTRSKQIADWIMSLFEDKEIIPVQVIMRKARKQGFSEQMVQKTRRMLLEDKIGYSVKKGEGWSWVRMDE